MNFRHLLGCDTKEDHQYFKTIIRPKQVQVYSLKDCRHELCLNLLGSNNSTTTLPLYRNA